MDVLLATIAIGIFSTISFYELSLHNNNVLNILLY